MVNLLQRIRSATVGRVMQSRWYSNLSSRQRRQSTQPIKLQSNVVPFAPAAGAAAIGVSKAGGALKAGYNFLKTFAAKKTINPAAGVSGAKNIAKVIGKSVGIAGLAGGLFGVGKTVSKAAVSGELPSAGEAAKTIAKTTAAGAGIGFSPIGGGIGILEGTGRSVEKTAQNFWNILKGKGQSMIPDNWQPSTDKFKDIVNDLPTSPTYNIYNQMPTGFTPSDILPQTPQAVYIESPAVPSISTPSFSPSISLGGGMGGLGENLPLLLLLGAGIGGYALGRRKRKKKKYKKRKR